MTALEQAQARVEACRFAHSMSSWRMGPAKLRELREAEAQLRELEAAEALALATTWERLERTARTQQQQHNHGSR